MMSETECYHDEESPPVPAPDFPNDVDKKSNDGKINTASPSSPPPPSPSFRKFFLLAKPEFPALVVAFFLMIAAEATILVTPLLLANAYDAIVDPAASPTEKMQDVNRTMILVLLIQLSGMVAGFFRGSIMGAAGERVVARLRNRLYNSILKQEIAFFDANKSGELVSRLGSDTTLVQLSVAQSIPEIAMGFVKVVVCLLLMFWISSKLAGITIGMVVILFLMVIPFGAWLGRLSKLYQSILGTAQTKSTEALGGMRTVQSFAAEERESERYKDPIGDPDSFRFWIPDKKETTYKVGFQKSLVGVTFFTILFGVGFGMLNIVLWYGFKLLIDEEITLGQLTAFQAYVMQIGMGLATTSGHLTRVLEAKGASARIFQLLERIPEIPIAITSKHHATAAIKPVRMIGNILFKDVFFSYPTRMNVPVLRNFSLNIPENTTVALVGSSGAGKSTVVSLLQRFYDVDSGRVSIDGNDITTLDLKWLRENIGYVQQEPHLFGLTIKENVCYGMAGNVANDRIEAACKEANAHDFIMKFTEGYDSMVGERGIQLSGGQKQRIAIARALLVNPRILLLDEATSALDAESEHQVQEAIEKAMIGRTVVIVAHRLSTIKRSNKIVVMDDHAIVDMGTHQELLGRCTKYQDLIKRQTNASATM